MSTFLSYFNAELINAIYHTLLHSLWQIPLIALGIKLAVKHFQVYSSKRTVHTNLSVLIISLIVSSFTFLFYSFREIPEIVVNTPSETGMIPITLDNIGSSESIITTSSWTDWLVNYNSVIVLVWTIGVAVFLGRFLVGWLGIQYIRRNAITDIPIEIQSAFSTILKKLNIKRHIQLGLSDIIPIPMVMGHVKPIVLLPLASINQLTIDEVEAILAHELAHVLHYDIIKNFIVILAEAIFFYHPVIWLLTSEIKEKREHICDDTVMKVLPDRLHYAKTLIKLGEIYQSRESHLTLALFNNKFKLMKRVKRILNLQNEPRSSKTRGMIIALVLGGFVIFTSAGIMQQVNTQEAEILTELTTDSDLPSAYVSPIAQLKPLSEIVSDLAASSATKTEEADEWQELTDHIASPGLLSDETKVISYHAEGRLSFLPTMTPQWSEIDIITTLPDTLDPKEREELRRKMRAKRAELRKTMRAQKDKMREQRNKVREEYRSLMEKQRKELRTLRKKLGKDDQSYNFNFNWNWSDEEREEWVQKMQEWGEKFGEEFSQEFNEEWVEDMQKWGEKYGEKMGKWGEKYGKRMAEWGEKYGAQFGEEFGAEYGELFDEEWVAGLEDLGAQMEHTFDEEWLEGIASIGTEVAVAVQEAMRDFDFDELEYDYTYGDISNSQQLKEQLVDALNKDGLLTDDKNSITITDNKMTVNGVSQSSDRLKKYQKIIQSNSESAFRKGKTNVKFKIQGKSLEDSKSTGITIDIND